MGNVLVIKNGDLWKTKPWGHDCGVIVSDRIIKAIIEKSFWHDHFSAGKKLSLKQIVLCLVIANPVLNTLFLCRRKSSKISGEGEIGEAGKWQCCLNAHVFQKKDGVAGPLFSAFLRQLGEKVDLDKRGISDFKPLGYLGQCGDEISAKHFAILNIFNSSGWACLKALDPKIFESRMVPCAEAREIIYSSENNSSFWTKTIFSFLESYYLRGSRGGK